jgi:antibiotic biosynthesis monooxygenase (ABM) superfamily enzyme
MRPTRSTSEEPTDVVSEHQVARDRMASFSTSVKGLLSAASRSQGYLDGGMERARDRPANWLVTCRFDSSENAEGWTRSRSSAMWHEYIDRFSVRVGTRTPAMPAGPDAPARPGPPRPPPRWKMAIATLTGVFPAVLLVNLTIIPVPQVASLPFILRTLVLCVCVTGLMTWVLMPQVQKLLGPWLRRGIAPPAVPGGNAVGPHAVRAPAMPPDPGVRRTARPRHSAPATSSPRGRPSPSRSR